MIIDWFFTCGQKSATANASHEPNLTDLRMQEISTLRLLLQPLTAAHAELLFGVMQDHALYAFIATPYPTDLEFYRQRLKTLCKCTSADGEEQWLNWTLRLRVDGAAIGYIQATVFADRTAEIGYVIGVPFQRNGYATEALTLLCSHLHMAYAADAVFANVKLANLPSVALLQKLGFDRALAHPGDPQTVTFWRRPLQALADLPTMAAQSRLE
jgi:[ribosomal protein S5]-alanine N-acetyltransferase